jgi:hypothetical protein
MGLVISAGWGNLQDDDVTPSRQHQVSRPNRNNTGKAAEKKNIAPINFIGHDRTEFTVEKGHKEIHTHCTG